MKLAVSEKANAVAHGATGKGNDQVRFELCYYALKPDIKVISPWKDREFLEKFKGRTDLLKYAAEKKIPVKASIDKPYSEDDNLMHISHEAGILEDPMYTAQKSILEKMVLPQDAPDKETRIAIHFKNGIPVKLINKEDGTVKEDSYEMFTYLNELAGKNGIGLLDMVENRFVGIKSRGVYETPAATVLHIAHMDLEGIAMDREVMRLRNMLTPKFSELIYYGFWFSPEMDFLMAAIEKSQELIDGSVHLCLYKGNVLIEGRESPSSLYNKELSSMDIEGGFDQTDSKGFIRINAIRLMAHRAIVEASRKQTLMENQYLSLIKTRKHLLTNMKLWEKNAVPDPSVIEFTSGRDRTTDLCLAEWDIAGSMAHAIMLNETGLINDDRKERVAESSLFSF